MRHLPRLQNGLQHLKEFFLVGDGHTQQAGVRNTLQGILQRAECRVGLPNPAIEARVIAVANLPISHHAAVLQQRIHQSLTDSVIVRQIVAIRKVEQIRVPAVTRVMELQMRQRELIGGRTARPPPWDMAKKSCSGTTCASVSCAMNTISTFWYLSCRKRTIQKKKLLARYFLLVVIEPLTSMSM